MAAKQSVSLQKQLIKTSLLSAIWAGLISLFLMVGFGLYHVMSVHDELMDEVADMLIATDLTRVNGKQIDELSEEFDMHYQLFRGSDLLTQSEKKEEVNTTAMAIENGHHFVWSDGQLWRSYQQQDDGLTVQIIQPIEKRVLETLQSVMGYTGILLIVWLIQWLLLHIYIKRQLKVLNIFSAKIAQKSADDLAPIELPHPILDELAPIQTQLNYLLQRLELSLQAEQRFTADASHELRSPLSAIQMRLQVLKRRYPDIQQDLEVIQKDVTRGTRVLENLLILARLDPTDTAQVEKQKADLQQVTLQAFEALQPFADEKGTHWKMNIFPLHINMNSELIYTCIRNLIDNAIRYTPEQGMVQIDFIDELKTVIWQIENTGLGLTEQEIQRIGERFYRILGNKTEGSGLGVSIAQKIIQLHQGTLEIAASQLGGLKIQIRLPKN
ncbi:sensor histidine kinase [Acinetobacter gandensis]|uniref:sensor histidine kinase n=1 Tax=Acinetobacter gandensis TaxID=1443941 RepID=UPI003F55C9FC